MRNPTTLTNSLLISGLFLGLSFGVDFAAAEDVHLCNGVYTTQPCDQVPQNMAPGVSTVPGRDLTVAPVPSDNQGQAKQDFYPNPQPNNANNNSDNNSDDVEVDYDGDPYYDGYPNLNRREVNQLQRDANGNIARQGAAIEHHREGGGGGRRR